jgi:hypothetical protein
MASIEQRSVCACDQIPKLVISAKLTDPDREAPLARAASEIGAHHGDPLTGLHESDTADRECELVAAETDDRLVRANVGLDRADDVAEQLVTGRMAELVVDLFEALDVHDDEYERLARSPGTGDLSAQGLLPDSAAVGPGEVVEMRGLDRGERLGALLGRAEPVEGGLPAILGGQRALGGCLGPQIRGVGEGGLERAPSGQRTLVLPHRAIPPLRVVIARLGREVALPRELIVPARLTGPLLDHPQARGGLTLAATRHSAGARSVIGPLPIGRKSLGQRSYLTRSRSREARARGRLSELPATPGPRLRRVLKRLVAELVQCGTT